MKIIKDFKERLKKYDADSLVIGTVGYYAAIYKHPNHEGVVCKEFPCSGIDEELEISEDIAERTGEGVYTSVLKGTEYIQDANLAFSRIEEPEKYQESVDDLGPLGYTYMSRDNVLLYEQPLTDVFPQMKGKKVSKRTIERALRVRKAELLAKKQREAAVDQEGPEDSDEPQF